MKRMMTLMALMAMTWCVMADTEVVDGIEWTYEVNGGKATIVNYIDDDQELCMSAIPYDTKGAITIPSTLGGCPVTSIGGYAFEYCSALTSVTIPPSVTSIGMYAFFYCFGLTSMTIPSSVTSIGDFAFSYCDGLTSMTIPASVTSIGGGAFNGCYTVSVASDNKHYKDVDGILFSKSGKEIVSCSCSKSGHYDIPSSVTSIGDDAFWGCERLTSVTIPSSVMSIGECAFCLCNGLTSVEIASGALSIGNASFSSCTGLTSVKIPSSVTSIGVSAFYGCNKLETIYVSKGDAARVKKMLEDSGSWSEGSYRKPIADQVRYVEVEDGSDPVVPDDPDDPDDPIDYEPMDASVANTYDGVICDEEGLPAGYITVKTAKASGKGEAQTSKLTVTVQMAGDTKKVSIAGSLVVADGTAMMAAKDGRVLVLTFTHDAISGTFDGYKVSGSRNLFASKVSDEKAEANDVLNVWKGNYVLAFEDDNGWNGLSVSIAAQGKVKVSGKLANGTSVSVTSQLIIGDETSTIPVVCTKKNVSLAFCITLANDGSEMSVASAYNAIISSVGNIGSGLAFHLGDDFYALYNDVELLDFLPDGVSVEPSGTKWIVANGEKKVGKIVIDGESGAAYDKNESANPSGLKLTYASKTGTFKGSFKVYYLANGKVKNDSATITGFVVDGIGYGTVTIKKRGSAGVSIK